MDYNDPREYKAKKNQELLSKIEQLESSGGRDLAHVPLEDGIHAGEAAIGNYGLMPNTLRELADRYPSETTKNLSKQQLLEKADLDPNFAKTMAQTLVSHLKQKRGLSDEETAAAWEAGHNLPVEKIQEKLDTPRARKFKVLEKK